MSAATPTTLQFILCEKAGEGIDKGQRTGPALREAAWYRRCFGELGSFQRDGA
jgi:hypothetical protein